MPRELLERATSYEIAEVLAYYRARDEIREEKEQQERQNKANAALKAMFSQ